MIPLFPAPEPTDLPAHRQLSPITPGLHASGDLSPTRAGAYYSDRRYSGDGGRHPSAPRRTSRHRRRPQWQLDDRTGAMTRLRLTAGHTPDIPAARPDRTLTCARHHRADEPSWWRETHVDMHLNITGEEWEIALGLVRFTSGDERQTLGMVHLACDGGIRRWTATNSRWLASHTTDGDAGSYELLVSPRIVQFGYAAAASGQDAAIVISHADDGGPDTVTVVSDSESLTVAADRSTYPRSALEMASDPVAAGASVQVDGRDLERVMSAAAIRAIPDGDDTSEPLFWVTVDSDGLRADLSWEHLGLTTFRAAGAGSGNARRAFPPLQVAEAVGGWKGQVTFTVPDDPHAPLRIADDERTVLIMPIDTTHERQRKHVEDVLAEVFGPDVLHRDGDDDYPLTISGVPVYARLVDDRPPTVQVFASLLVDIDCTPDLLQELNDHNANISFARLFWVQDQILAESDLVASTLDPEELFTAYQRVVDVSEHLAPMIHAVLGGTSTVRSIEARWAKYRATIVEAETTPGTWITLTGPSAATPWPYPGAVHVITASNPSGRLRPEEINRRASLELGRDLLAAGAGLSRASGSDPDPSEGHAEHGFLAWGIDRNLAAELAAAHGQDAIFEIDADRVHVVSCRDDRLDTLARTHQGDSTLA